MVYALFLIHIKVKWFANCKKRTGVRFTIMSKILVVHRVGKKLGQGYRKGNWARKSMGKMGSGYRWRNWLGVLVGRWSFDKLEARTFI